MSLQINFLCELGQLKKTNKREKRVVLILHDKIFDPISWLHTQIALNLTKTT